MMRRPSAKLWRRRLGLRIPSRAGVQRRISASMDATRRAVARSRARKLLRALPDQAKVHLGCGENLIEGWVNIDINRAVQPDVRLDLRGGFPARPGSVGFVFSEHVFEHLTLEDGCRIFADCHAALQPGGVMRIAMPDLRHIVERYIDGRYEGEGGPETRCDTEYRSIDSPARLLNFALRSWGHIYLYDVDELSLRLREAGFAKVERRKIRGSLHPELVELEKRDSSRLIVEATKR